MIKFNINLGQKIITEWCVLLNVGIFEGSHLLIIIPIALRLKLIEREILDLDGD